MSRQLIEAIRKGDLSLVNDLVDRGADPNYRLPSESDHGEFFSQVTPFMVAVSAPKSSAEIVQLLLGKGADPFAKSAGGVTATWYACGGGTGYSPDQAARDALE
jgi:ankyrin repeat protein